MVLVAAQDAQDVEDTPVVAGEESPGPHINVVAADEVTCHNMHCILSALARFNRIHRPINGWIFNM